MAKLQFSKMHGLGNDFIVIDAINQQFELSCEQIRMMANRHLGIGFDQLLLVEKSSHTEVDFKYRIFNADGGEVEQCGNGARCFAQFVHKKGLTDKNPIKVETNTGVIDLTLRRNDVVVNMGIPDFDPKSLPFLSEKTEQLEENDYQLAIEHSNSPLNFSAVSVGNPHITIINQDIVNYPVTEVGKILESQDCFPNRINVGFMQIESHQKIKLRVFERGCGETLACGTGACAAVVNGISRGLLANRVQVELKGGALNISWNGPDQPIWMEGPASFVYEGQIDL